MTQKHLIQLVFVNMSLENVYVIVCFKAVLRKCFNSLFAGYYSFAKNALDLETQPNKQSLATNLKSIVVDH